MRLWLILVSLAVLGGGPASAAPAYTADQIIKSFMARSICVGPESVCGSAPSASAANEGATFNLLVTFELDSADLTQTAKENLDQFAIALKNPEMARATFQVEGHTDARGGDDYNLKLSERRALAVVEYLRSRGANTSKLSIKGYGKSHPRTADPLDPENRRVEARLLSE